MRISKLLLAAATLLLFLGTVPACSESSAATNDGTDRQVSNAQATALATSYMDTILGCRFSTNDSALAEESGLGRQMNERLNAARGKEVPDRELTAGELRRLGLWRLPNGTSTIYPMTITKVSSYYDDNGKLPKTGLDLFPELGTVEGLSDLAAMPASEVLNRYREGIDPITGHFYTDLQAQQWAAAAMNLRVVDDPEELQRLFPHRRIAVTTFSREAGAQDTGERVRPQQAWYIRIYGEASGTVLYETVAWMN